MGLGSSLDRARIHRSIQQLAVPVAGATGTVDVDITLNPPVTSTRWIAWRQPANFAANLVINSITLVNSTTLRINITRGTTAIGTELWVLEEFF